MEMCQFKEQKEAEGSGEPSCLLAGTSGQSRWNTRSGLGFRNRIVHPGAALGGHSRVYTVGDTGRRSDSSNDGFLANASARRRVMGVR